MNKFITLTTIIFFLKIHFVSAQVDTIFHHRNLTFKEYLYMVSSHNLEYAAEKYNVIISEAAIEASKIFPDPYISLNMTEELEKGSRKGYGYSSELGTTIETGGKRKARIDLAKSANELSKALLADYFRNLQAEATLVYLDAMKQKQLFLVGSDSYQTMKQLAEADSIRLKLGSIMEIDAIQSKLEAGTLYNELMLSFTGWKNSLVFMTSITGISKADTLFVPVSHLQDTCRLFSLDYLIVTAQNNRSDLLAALKNKEVSQKAFQLAKKERKIDLDLKLGVSNSFITDAITPKATGFEGGIDIPLKLSNYYKGDIKMAKAHIDQTEEIFRMIEIQIKAEITQAWNLYYVYCNQVDSFKSGLLKMASDVLKGKIYSYRRGETSLLEVLNAQRTYNEIQTTYYEALFNRAVALVELEKTAGIWDITF